MNIGPQHEWYRRFQNGFKKRDRKFRVGYIHSEVRTGKWLLKCRTTPVNKFLEESFMLGIQKSKPKAAIKEVEKN